MFKNPNFKWLISYGKKGYYTHLKPFQLQAVAVQSQTQWCAGSSRSVTDAVGVRAVAVGAVLTAPVVKARDKEGRASEGPAGGSTGNRGPRSCWCGATGPITVFRRRGGEAVGRGGRGAVQLPPLLRRGADGVVVGGLIGGGVMWMVRAVRVMRVVRVGAV